MALTRRVLKSFNRTKQKPEAQVEAKWGEGFLSGLVMTMDKAEPERMRVDVDYVHVSSMVGWCPRLFALLRKYPQEQMPVKSGITGGHRIMWEIGRAVEKHVRRQIIKALGYQGVYGVWKCVCGKTKHTGYHRKKECRICGTFMDEYHEYTLVDRAHGVRGNPDLILVIDGVLHIVEIKSITNAKQDDPKALTFDNLKQPLADHVFQVTSYRLIAAKSLAKRLGVKVGGVAVFYTTKEFRWGAPYKDFYFTPSVVQKRLVNYERKQAKSIKEGVIPPKEQCSSIKSPKAKGCPRCTECFALDKHNQ